MLYVLAMLNPCAYRVMKNAAYLRHLALKNLIERDPAPLSKTWHQGLIDWVYPL